MMGGRGFARADGVNQGPGPGKRAEKFQQLLGASAMTWGPLHLATRAAHPALLRPLLVRKEGVRPAGGRSPRACGQPGHHVAEGDWLPPSSPLPKRTQEPPSLLPRTSKPSLEAVGREIGMALGKKSK